MENDFLKTGDKIYGIFKNVSKNGMTRTYQILKVENGAILDISHKVAKILDYEFNSNHNGVRVKGCGMDMLSYTINELESVLNIKLQYSYL